MTHVAGDNVVTGYYDADTDKAHGGTYMQFSENYGSYQYYHTGWPFINILKGSQLQDLTGATHVGNKFFDTSGGGTWRQILISLDDGADVWMPAGDWVIRWVGTCATEWLLAADPACTDNADQTNTLIAGQTETDFDNSPTDEGTFVGGTGHAATDVMTLVSGATVTVDTVSGGVVTEFTIDAGNGTLAPATGDDGTQTVGGVDNQNSTTGSGINFALTPDDLNILHRRTYTCVGSPLFFTASMNGRLQMTNGTCTRLEALQPGNESRFDADNIMAAGWITDQSGVAVLRTMGWQQTNASPFRTHTNANQFDAYEWGGKGALSVAVPCNSAVPIRALCFAANELNADLWLNVPHQYTDAAVTDLANDVNTHLTGHAYIEWGNEVWNTSGPFRDAFRWTTRLTNPVLEGVLTTATASAAIANHGFINQEEILLFSQELSWQRQVDPYRYGANAFVTFDDANTFRLANTAAMAGRGNDVTSTGDADYDPLYDTTINNTEMNYIRVKKEAGSGDVNTNYAIRAAEVWALAKAVLGTKMSAIGCGQRTNTGVATTHMENADFRANVDFYGVASYYRFIDLSSANRSWNRITFLIDTQDETNYDSSPITEGSFSGGTGHNVSDVISLGYIFTADVVDDELVGISFMSDGHPIQFETTGTLPAPLQLATTYYSINRANGPDTIQVAATVGGDPIVLTDAGTGVHRLSGTIDVTVDAVGSGIVTQFTVDSSNDPGWHHPGENAIQISSTGGGVNFFLTPEDDNINVDPTVDMDATYNYLLTSNGPTVLIQQQNNINAVGRDILVNYEGFDHEGSAGWSYGIPTIGTLITDWAAALQSTTWNTYWAQQLSGKEVHICSHHVDYSQYDESGIWGRQENQTDLDARAQVGLQGFLDNSGNVPKP